MNAVTDGTRSAKLPAAQLRMRNMLVEDMRAVMAIERRAYEFPWTEAIFIDCLKAGNCCRVLEQEDEIIAYVVMSVAAGEAHILNLCTRPESRRRGIAHILLQKMIELARKQHADTMFLEVRPSNAAARGLYFKAGFSEIGVRRNYYPARLGREDAMILARHL